MLFRRDLLVAWRNGLQTRRSEGPTEGICCKAWPDIEGIETRAPDGWTFGSSGICKASPDIEGIETIAPESLAL